ncbi:plasmid pRiA4b ORF-3 family protein [Cryobacterium psychrophilum]|uniref:Plasmid pRiA4b ORF-3 family protein n=1 Tax=Cryobacterium psychrophilum TaxID=41988 RepID=A0A4Y8KM30_9MICO|nr:plasmid pRiA4b ORF-3 family protein [Cryobacterium psychrophilum]TFD78617.1 plasmid pRiA4b ORF-3 family protein [Cryobacterium psychrophilum]
MTPQPTEPPSSDPAAVIDFAAARLRLRADDQPNDHGWALTDADESHRPLAKKPLPLLTPPVEPMRFTLRIDIVDSAPPIWRRLSLPSNLTLDRLHDVLQAAFGWTDSHLHQFTPADDLHRHEFEGILTPFDLAEGEEGVLESELRLDQLLGAPGDTLSYAYDFGDDWEHLLTLETVEPATTPSAVRCLDGGRQGPREDSGGIHYYDHLIEVATTPGHRDYRQMQDEISAFELWNFRDDIDLDAINRALDRVMNAEQALAWLRAHGGQSPVATLVATVGEDAQRYLAGFLAAARISEPVGVTLDEAKKATAVIRTLLRHVGEGIRLTGAGFLPPAAVIALMAELDPEGRSYGKANREANMPSLFALREVVTGLGLLRKYKGMLVLTKRGVQLRDAPLKLWHYLAQRMPVERTPHGHDSALVLLMLVAAGEAKSLGEMAQLLDVLTSVVGWQVEPTGRYGYSPALRAARGTTYLLTWAGKGSILLGRYSDSLDLPGSALLARATLLVES